MAWQQQHGTNGAKGGHRHRGRWSWPAFSALVGTLACALALPSLAPAGQPTSPVQHAPQQIFQKTGVVEGQSGNTVTFSFDVPAGKVLVVEHLSVRVFVPSGQLVSAQLNCHGSSQGAFDFTSKFLLFQRTTLATQDRFDADQLVRCYVAGGASGSELTAVVQRNLVAGEFVSVDFSISGYLIAAP
jgi:hypothetical protein